MMIKKRLVYETDYDSFFFFSRNEGGETDKWAIKLREKEKKKVRWFGLEYN